MSIGPVPRGVMYRFDSFELLPEREELRKHGSLVHLSPQAFRVLMLLLARRGEVVTRADIQSELWSDGRFVDYEQGINTVIRRIRHALNDNAETPRYLQTLPRRGYSFVGNVECITRDDVLVPHEDMLLPPPLHLVPAVEEPEAMRTRLHRAPLAVLFLLLLGARGPVLHKQWRDPHVLRVAIVPTRAAGATAGEVRTLATELQSRIAHLSPHRLEVVDKSDAPDLNIEATASRVLDSARVEARIVDARNGREIWAETFNRASAGQADFPYEVSLRIKNAIALRYLPSRSEPILRSKVSPAVLRQYRRARTERNLPMAQRDLDRALALFADATKTDPQFAEAWSGIGDIWLERANNGMGEVSATAVRHARAALRQALAIDPHSIEANNDYALLLMRYDRDYAGAERLLRRALDGDPDYVDANVNLAFLLTALGNFDAGIEQLRHTQWLDPIAYSPSTTSGFLYLMARRYDDAASEYRATLLISRFPQNAQWGLVFTENAAGRTESATRALYGLMNIPKAPSSRADSRNEFNNAFMELETNLLEREQAQQIDSYVLACYYAVRNDADRAFAKLDRAIDDKSGLVLFTAVDPRLDNLRKDPRFEDRLRRLHFIE